ncbi:MAG TPA: DUF6079 family protein, partial [bacterium]|nr:DUF6079 family protein [bacterium]
KAKPDNRTLNEDTRFLQFLGEASKTRPLWIAAALQENIERTGEISPAVLKKIKDRYHQRLRLSTRHLHTLISQRLIQKKHPNAESIIHAVFERLQRAFNRIPMNRETFQTIYPVHPETLELLNQNIDLFSQRRGIIDFLSVRIRGRGTDRIPGILDRPCDHLLTPDVIFDHFFDRLASAPQFSDYYMLFQQEFAPRVPRVFPDPAERDAAERTLKILILLAVSPFREERTVRELANMILYCALDPSIAAGETNYAFFEERIIRKLYENVGFLQRVAGKTRLEDVYKIGIMPGQTETLEDRLDRIKSGMEPDMREGLVDIVTAMGHGEFPLALFFNRTAIREAVLWQNTRRRIGIRMLHFSDLNSDDVSEMRDELRTGRLDMVLLLAFPGDSVTHQLEAQGFLSRESGETLSAWTFVIPESLEHAEMKNCLVELQACRILIRDLGTEQDSGSIEYLGMVKERRERFLETGRSLLVRAFQNAVLFTAEGRLEISGGKASEPFDRWLESVTGPALNRRFPDHHQIAPMADCTSRVLQQMILDRLVKPGRLTRKQAARDDALIGAVESVMIPLGLAQKKRDDYILTGTPKTSIAARFVMDYLPITESLDYAGGDTRIAAGRVWLSVHSSRFGMARPVFDLTLATLIRKGFVSAYLNDRQVSLDSLEMPLTGQIDRLSRGPLLPDHLKPAFRRLYKLLTHRELADWDMDLQEQLWKKTVAQIDLWIETAGEFQRCLEQIRARFPDSVLELRRTGQMLEQLQELKNALGEADSVVPNWHGFLPVFDASDSIEDWNRGLKHLKSFVSIGFAPYMAAKSYLSDPRLAFPDTSDFETIRKLSKEVFELSQISDERVLDSGLKPFLDKFDQFLKEYSKLYIAAHQRKNQSIRDQKYHDVLKSLEVQVFERLQSVPLIRRMCHNRRPLQTALNASRAICTLDPEPMLLSTPACRCGFVPGTTDDIPDARELLDRIRSQLGIAVDIIQSPEVHGKLMELAASADQTDLEASVNQLLTMDARDPDFVTRLDGILDTRMLRLLQKVDTTRSPKAVLRLRQLTALLD